MVNKSFTKNTTPLGKKGVHNWMASLSLIFVFCTIYYSLSWKTPQGMAEKLDPCGQLFCDFTVHYYPTAHSIFEIKEPIYGYLYSPFFAILTSPFGRLPLASASLLWGVIQILLTLLLFIMPISTLKLDTLKSQLLYSGLFFTSLPVLHNFKWGQVSSLMVLTILGAFLAHRSGRPIWAGVLLGVSTSIKYYPGFFILYFLFKKDKLAIASFALTCFLLLFLLPVLMLGFDHWLNFMVLSLQKISLLGDTSLNPNTQFFPHVLMRLLDLDPARVFVVRVLRYAGITIAAFNIFLLWKINKSQMDESGILSAALLFCSLPFLIETSWHHYFIFLPFLQIAFFQIIQKQWLKFFVIGSMVLSSIFIVNLFPTWEDYTKWGFSFLSSSLILLTTYLLGLEKYREQQENTS